MVGPFSLGVVLPLILFAMPYARSGALGTLVREVFVEPTKRFGFATQPPVPLSTTWAATGGPLMLAPVWPVRDRINWSNPASRVAGFVIGAAAGFIGFRGGRAYADVWLMLRYLAPCTVAAGLLLLAGLRVSADIPARRKALIWLLVCMVAMCSLIQVPYAGSYYVLYFAPLAILALLAITASGDGRIRPPVAVAGGFFLLFGVACVNPGHVSVTGVYATAGIRGRSRDLPFHGPACWSGQQAPQPTLMSFG